MQFLSYCNEYGSSGGQNLRCGEHSKNETARSGCEILLNIFERFYNFKKGTEQSKLRNLA